MKNSIENIRNLPLSTVLKREELHLLSAREMNLLVIQGRLKAEQLFKYALDRIERDASGAFVGVDRSRLSFAQTIDQMTAERRGEDVGTLVGVIGTTKDTYRNTGVGRQFAGTRNPGSHPKKEWRANQDAFMVQWMKDNGLLLTATTETSNLALDTQVHNVRHPYGDHLAARGSSAGAAVAARLLGGIHLASDAAGSARAPMVYNSNTCGLMLPYSQKWIQGHKPPLFDDPRGLINFGRVGFASQYVDDLTLVSERLGFEIDGNLNRRLLLMGEFGNLSLNSDNANALEKGVQILRDNGFTIDEMDHFGDFEPDELIYSAGQAIGARIAANIKSGPWKKPLAKAIWSRTLASVIIGQMYDYYSKQAKQFAQGNAGQFLTGVLEGLRNWERCLAETDDARKRMGDVFRNIVTEGYDGILMPLDHAGQFKKCSTLEPIDGQPYFDATAGLPVIANMAPETSALAVPTGHFSGLPNGVQIVSSGSTAVSNVLQIGQIIQEKAK